MDLKEAMRARHSVRRYKNMPLGAEVISSLKAAIDACNRESGLHIQLITDEPRAFDGFMAHHGKFSGVTSYIALIGARGPELDEKCGYYGERLVLRAQQMGLEVHNKVETLEKKGVLAPRLSLGTIWEQVKLTQNIILFRVFIFMVNTFCYLSYLF